MKLLIVSVILSVLSGCDPNAVSTGPVQTKCDILATHSGNNTIIITVEARVYASSKSDGLRRVAAELTRTADDLERPLPPASSVNQGVNYFGEPNHVLPEIQDKK